MSKLHKLLFTDINDFEIEEIGSYPFSVANLIEEEKKKNTDMISSQFDQNMLEIDSKQCDPFRRSNAVKRKQQQEKVEQLVDWYGFKKQELSKEDEADIQILKLRRMIDPKGGIKNVDNINKDYLQVGTIIDESLHGRKNKLKKKEKKHRLYEQFLEEDKKLGFSKRKFKEIQTEKMNTSRNKKWLKLKKLRKFKRDMKDDVRELSFK